MRIALGSIVSIGSCYRPIIACILHRALRLVANVLGLPKRVSKGTYRVAQFLLQHGTTLTYLAQYLRRLREVGQDRMMHGMSAE